jgi:hypothetical protein
MRGDPFAEACWSGAIARLDEILDERLKRLRELAAKMPESLALARSRAGAGPDSEPYAGQQAFLRAWPRIEERLAAPPPENTGARERDAFLKEWESISSGTAYADAVGATSPEARAAATAWLQSVVDLYSGDHRS